MPEQWYGFAGRKASPENGDGTNLQMVTNPQVWGKLKLLQ
jgi:hypothetical protein